MDEAEWARIDLTEVFPDYVRKYVSLATFCVDADSDLAREFLLEPLRFLAENVDGVEPDWTVSLDRVNADESLSGPRKIVVIIVVLALLRTAHLVVYRLPDVE